jgi:hypothetical protein
MAWEGLRNGISRMAGLPELMLAIVEAQDEQEITCLGSICKRLPLGEHTFTAVTKLECFKALLHLVQAFGDSSIGYIGIDILKLFALIGYCEDYLQFVQLLRRHLNASDPRVSRSAFLSLYVMSGYSQCALQFKKLKLDREVKQVVTGAAHAKKLAKFLKNVANPT